jgi:hypothetical protein
VSHRAVAITLAALTLTACGGRTETPTATDARSSPPSRTASTADGADASRLAAYEALSQQVNGFFEAAAATQDAWLVADPRTVEEMVEVTGYAFEGGVALAEYTQDEELMCFTGPDGTFMSLSVPDGDEEVLRRLLGRGACAYDDAEIVLQVLVLDDSIDRRLNERAVKGRQLAAQVPSLAEFVDVLNAGTATTVTIPTAAATEAATGGPDPKEQRLLAAYEVLASDMNGFFDAAFAKDSQSSGGMPENLEDLVEWVGYDFRDDVALETFDASGGLICFTGREDTYLAMSEPEDAGDLQRTMGTGPCDYERGAVVTVARESRGTFRERVVRGVALWAQVPALADFAGMVNSVTPDPGPEDLDATEPSSTERPHN